MTMSTRDLASEGLRETGPQHLEGVLIVRSAHLTFSTQAIEQFCQRWQVAELALFSSILTDEFGPRQ